MLLELFEIPLKASYITMKDRDEIPMILIHFTFDSLSKLCGEKYQIAILFLRGWNQGQCLY